ncbi:toprim domain-containing protein [Helicobacter sp. 10-6591]|uniref:toprim domain-containing protein n=1 Tax=Helicobacter sp. 10-6591 TaxID=2004998 RepID=UPI000DCD8890|nr:toprim domain-containing protein [Helicobacter sp. 10-6591]RAX55475.1 hypothetical protein CCY97_04205 [Helicobacter sp. 10-6591]
MQDLTKLPLHEVLLANGYLLDRSKSSSKYPCLKNPQNGEKLIVTKKGENYLYFNPQDDIDRGNIISFARIHKLDIKKLIANYDSAIKINGSYKLEYFRAQSNPLKHNEEYKTFEACDIANNALLKHRGFDVNYMLEFQSILKQDNYSNLVIPNYKLQSHPSNEDGYILICGYTKRLNIPITKDRDGNLLEKPIKSLQYGKKGIEILNINKDPKAIRNVIISESIFDSLALGQMYKHKFDPKETLFLSTAGSFNEIKHSFKPILEKLSNTKISLAFDNDEKGHAYTEEMQNFILKEFKKLPNVYKPFSKDCNDDLRLKNITNLKNFNQESYQEWAQQKMLYYRGKKDPAIRAKFLKDLRTANSLYPFSDETKQKFNDLRKHKRVKNFEI